MPGARRCRALPRPQRAARPGRHRPRRRDPVPRRLAGRRRPAYPGGRWLSRTDAKAAAERFGGSPRPPAPGDPDRTAGVPAPRRGRRTRAPAAAARRPRRRGDPARPRPGDHSGGDWRPNSSSAPTASVRRPRARSSPPTPGALYAGFTTWRIVIPPPARPFAPHETWGSGRIWGTHPLRTARSTPTRGRRRPAGGHAADGEKAELLRRFGDWHDPIPAIIDAAGPTRCCATTSTTSPSRCPPSTAAGSRSSATQRTPCLRPSARAATRPSRTPSCSPTTPTPRTRPWASPRTPPHAGRVHRHRPQGGQLGRVNMLGRPAWRCATPSSPLSKTGPAVLLRGFDEIADWRPPQRPYAAQTRRA